MGDHIYIVESYNPSSFCFSQKKVIGVYFTREKAVARQIDYCGSGYGITAVSHCNATSLSTVNGYDELQRPVRTYIRKYPIGHQETDI